MSHKPGESQRFTSADGPARLRRDPLTAPVVAKLVKALPQEQELSEFQLARVHRNLMAPVRTGRGRLYFGVRATVLASLLIVAASVGAAAAMVSVRWFHRSETLVKPAASPARPSGKAKPRRWARVVEPTPIATLVAERVATPAPTAAVPVARSKPPEVVVPQEPQVTSRGSSAFATKLGRPVPGLAPPNATPSAVEEEAAAMSGALRLLRAGDRTAAIEQLRLYVQRFPKGAFAEEAQVALVSALVETGAHTEAEAALNKVTGGASASPALRLLRAELEFASVCAAPLRLFEDVLAKAPALRERALYGAAMANARCGDRARGQRLMHEFLKAFPQSPRRHSVENHLHSMD